MGLSEECRYSYVVESVEKIARIGRSVSKRLDEGSRFPYDEAEAAREFCRLADKLWPAFVKVNNHKNLWLFGDTASEPVALGIFSPWGEVMAHHFGEVRKARSERIRAEKVAEGKELTPRELFDENMEAYNYETESYAIEEFLRVEESMRADLLQAFRATETIFYAIARYPGDAFYRKYEPVLDVASNIHGALISVFRTNDTYAKACLLHWLMREIFQDKRGAPWRFVDELILWGSLKYAVNLEFESVLLLDEHRFVTPWGQREKLLVLIEAIAQHVSERDLDKVADILATTGATMEDVLRAIEAGKKLERYDRTAGGVRKLSRLDEAVVVHGWDIQERMPSEDDEE